MSLCTYGVCIQFKFQLFISNGAQIFVFLDYLNFLTMNTNRGQGSKSMFMKINIIPFVLNTLMSRKDCPHHATTGPRSWSVSLSRETKQVPIGTRKNSLDRLHQPHWSQYSTVGKEIVRNVYHKSLNPFQRSETHLVRVTVLLGLQLPIILVIEQSVSSDEKYFGLSNEHKYSKEKKHASFRMSCSLVSIFKMGMI